MPDFLRQTDSIPRKFFEQPADLLAPALLGTVLLHNQMAGMITETEAYLGLTDLAAHASRGVTNRTRVMFGPAGYAYVYLIYGIHECLNVVAGKPGIPHCVLIRALEPLAGIDSPCNGPGKLTRAMGINRSHYGADLCAGPLQIRRFKEHPRQFAIEVTPRIGIRHNADWLLRFVVAK